jgi:hypothetical protein
MSIKIQINSLEALERMIGGNSELEISIRNSIVQQFTKKHLKGIATDNITKLVEQQIVEETQKHFFDITPKKGWDPEKFILKPHLKEIIQKYAEENNNHFLRTLVKDSLKVEEARNFVTDLLEKQSKYIKAELSNNELEKRLNLMVDARLKEKLGIKK